MLSKKLREKEHEDEVFALLDAYTRRRISRVLMYLLLFIGSIFSIIAPSVVLLEQSSTSLSRAWSMAFAVASLSCLIGSFFDRWVVEYTMIPLLFSTLIIFGVALLANSFSTGTGLTVPYACFFAAFAFGFFARWRDVQCIMRVESHIGGRM